MREALGIGLRGQIGNILQLVSLRLDQLIVPAFLSLSSAGVYLIAVRATEALAQVGSAAGSLIFPEVARQGDVVETSLTERAVRATSVMIGVAGLALGLLAEPFLAIAFGPEFTSGSLALRIMLVAMLPLSMARILAGDLKGRGRPGTVSIAMGLAAVITVLLDLVLIPRLGIVGAADRLGRRLHRLSDDPRHRLRAADGRGRPSIGAGPCGRRRRRSVSPLDPAGSAP